MPANKQIKAKFYQRHLLPILETWEQNNKKAILIGDFNSRIKTGDKWSSMPKIQKPEQYLLKDIIYNENKGKYTDMYTLLNEAQKCTNTKKNKKTGGHTLTTIDH